MNVVAWGVFARSDGEDLGDTVFAGGGVEDVEFYAYTTCRLAAIATRKRKWVIPKL
jgi:hypothetical protein